MPYQDRFALADRYIEHLDATFTELHDPFIESRYVGFVAVSAVTAYEQAIKDIFISFGEHTHPIFGEFVRSYFRRINGRISSQEIIGRYLPRFGGLYVNRFKEKRDQKEQEILRLNRKNILASYDNVIEWRNQFAHEGVIPNTVTFAEVRESYDYGKHIIYCLADTMVE